MSIERVLTRLQGVQRSGRGWLACCPAHLDRSPSLSIGEGSDGKILIKCFAGCSVESICQALQIRVSDLFVEHGTARERKPDIVRRTERQIADLRSRLTPRERVLPVTVVYCELENLAEGIARALALAVEGEIVQCLLPETR